MNMKLFLVGFAVILLLTQFNAVGQVDGYGDVLWKFNGQEVKKDTLVIFSSDVDKLEFVNKKDAVCLSNLAVNYCWRGRTETLDTIFGQDNNYKPTIQDFGASDTITFYRFSLCGIGTCLLPDLIDEEKVPKLTVIVYRLTTSPIFVVNGFMCSEMGTSVISNNSSEILSTVDFVLRDMNTVIDTQTFRSGELRFDNITKEGSYEIWTRSGQKIHEYKIATVSIETLPQPKFNKNIESTCPGESSEIEISGVKTNVFYRISRNKIVLDSFKAKNDSNVKKRLSLDGQYTITALDSMTGCMEVGGNEFTLLNLPDTTETRFVQKDTTVCPLSSLTLGLDMLKNDQLYIVYEGQNMLDTLTDSNNQMTVQVPDSKKDTILIYKVKVISKIKNCENFLLDSLIVNVISYPEIREVEGGGAYCEGGKGRDIFLRMPQQNVTYRLVLKGSLESDSVYRINNSKDTLSFTASKPGKYTIQAERNVKKCVVDMQGEVEISINTNPKITAIGFSDSRGVAINHSCQFDAADIFQIHLDSNKGKPPFSYVLDSGTYSSLQNSLAIPLNKFIQGDKASVRFKSITDSNGCSIRSDSIYSIPIRTLPQAAISVNSTNPVKYILTASNADRDSLLWSFSQKVTINGNSVDKTKDPLIEIAAVQGRGFTTTLLVYSGRCINKDYWFYQGQDSCILSNSVRKLCVDRQSLDTVLTFSSLESFTIADNFCPGCEVRHTNRGTNGIDSVYLKVYKITVNTKVKIPVKYSLNNPCKNKDGLVEFQIYPTGSTSASDFNPVPSYFKTICVDSRDSARFEISGVTPDTGLYLQYVNKLLDTSEIKIDKGKFAFNLYRSKPGEQSVELLSLLNKAGGCTKRLSFKFKYRVVECREPKTELKPDIILSGKYCLNQSDIVLKYSALPGDNPDTLAFSETYIIQAFVGENEIKGVLDTSNFSQTKRIVLFLDGLKFRPNEKVTIKITTIRVYKNAVSQPGSGICSFDINIGTTIAPVKSSIRKYPGNIYHYAGDPTGLCVAWGYAQVLIKDNKRIWGEKKEITNTSLGITQSLQKWAVFATDSISRKFETELKKGMPPGSSDLTYEAYLWADTWLQKEDKSCPNPDCVTRTYYNALLPLQGAPRTNEKAGTLHFWPNPSDGLVNVTIEGNDTGICSLWLTDIFGREVRHFPEFEKKEGFQIATIDVSGLENGLYILLMKNEEGRVHSGKLMIQKL